jgi:sporulation protein YlmC with PRC-barrel domain
MPGNIVSAVSEFLTPDLVSRMASVAGINDAALARRAVSAAAPAILSGMANLASKPRGAQSLADAIAKQSPNMLETLASTIGGSGRLADVGQQMLTSLFGARAFGFLASTVGKFVGLGDGPARSLLGLLTPAILGVLGREAGAGVTGLTQLLSAQKDQIAAAMPSGLSQALRASGFLDRASPVASMASRTDDTNRATREGVGTLARAVNSPATRPIHWAYWVLPLAAVAGLAWYMLGGQTPVAVAPTSAPTSPSAPGPSASDDLARRITATIDSLSASLQGVKDKASAAEALSQLQQANSELDGLSGVAGQLPTESRNRVADAIKTGSARLKSALDTVNALPGTPADVKSAIGNLQAKLDGLVTPGSLAQRRAASPEGKAAYVVTTPKGAVSARAYFDRDVYNNAGEKIGVVKDLVVGPEGGIYAAVIGVGNALGIGEKDVAVTFSSLRVTQLDNERRLVTDATKDALKEAPAYRDSSPPRN